MEETKCSSTSHDFCSVTIQDSTILIYCSNCGDTRQIWPSQQKMEVK